VRAGEEDDAELLWALRGGGGNFGVVTALEFRLHPVGPVVYGGLALYDPAHGGALARAFRDFHVGGGPEQAGLALAYLTAPPEDFVPEEWQGKLVAAVAGMWNGPVEEGERALQPLREVVESIADLFGEIPYAELQSMIDDPPDKRNWWTAEYLDELPDDAVDALVAYSEQLPLSYSQMLLLPWGGEVARRTDSPLAQRGAAYVVHPFCVWDGVERDEEHIAWGRAGRDVLARWKSGGVYLNFVGDEGEDRIRAAYGDAYERLAAVKERLDPGNLFRGNQNIRPRGQLVS
jgi:FAD/FMN-containing dehydrogenase